MKENEEESAWSIEVGLYPGVLLGVRTYSDEYSTTTVLYLPFVDIAYTYYY
jgi:hypothetical protein|tara:strand:- start:79 stop:231 length:153 start_codon:yes stop_codon:yes gene_type:complete